jgi:hypothetical protein
MSSESGSSQRTQRGHSGHDGIEVAALSSIASFRLDFSSKGGSAAKPPLSRFDARKDRQSRQARGPVVSVVTALCSP